MLSVLAAQVTLAEVTKATISGEFRSSTGAARFAAIRSYISTNRKQAQPIHHHFKDLFTPTGAATHPPTPAHPGSRQVEPI